jgi:hypothetical protein
MPGVVLVFRTLKWQSRIRITFNLVGCSGNPVGCSGFFPVFVEKSVPSKKCGAIA